jgi:4-hydroxy-tetrahydrodipicolinate synthase
MCPARLSERLRGIIPPLVTPLRAPDELDVAGLERLIERIIGGGVHGVFVLGSTGEGPSLSYRLRRELIERACRLVNHRVPVLVGITDTAFVESVTVARWAADAGADAVVAAPPYYLPAEQADLLRYFQRLATESPLPLVLYNMPGLTKVSIAPETVRQAMDQPQIIGLKDSSGSMSYLHQVVRLRGARIAWPVLVGDEETLPYAIAAGGCGGVHGGANVFPTLYTQLFAAAVSGDQARVRQLHALALRFGAIYRIGRPRDSACVLGIKCALSVLGVCDDRFAEPLHAFGESDRSSVRRILDELAPEIEDATGGRSTAAQGAA